MRKFHLILALLVVCVLLFQGFSVANRSTSANAANVAGLQDTLLNGLQARTPGDRAFVKKTVHYVEHNKLTRKIVMETFQYVRKKVSPKRRATTFQILLRRRAKAVGVTI